MEDHRDNNEEVDTSDPDWGIKAGLPVYFAKIDGVTRLCINHPIAGNMIPSPYPTKHISNLQTGEGGTWWPMVYRESLEIATKIVWGESLSDYDTQNLHSPDYKKMVKFLLPICQIVKDVYEQRGHKRKERNE